ncbi:MAG: type II secretion system F family protein [Gammaproteobacteria bacterium]|nr:type II secretion system F family protein [Gammaproteobacteria bacterium]
MPQFVYRGRDKEGKLRVGQRFAFDIDNLNAELIKEGISPIHIEAYKVKKNYWNKFREWMQGEALHLEELAIFSRQMQLLHQAGVPMTTALKQLASHTRSHRLSYALGGVIEHLEMGQNLATAMQHYPDAFSQLMVNIVQIGESTGHLSEAFAHLHKYIVFESASIKQIKSSFRYPIFVLVSIFFAIVVMNLFVIPNFAKFYTNMDVPLPWQTQLLISSSNFFVNYFLYLTIASVLALFFLFRWLKTPRGKFMWHRFQLKIPAVGSLLKRIILIRFCQSLAIVLNSGVSVTHGLVLVKNLLKNVYINNQISQMQESIERGMGFTQAIAQVELISPLELQILAVGEKNGELGPALSYIGDFHSHEIEFDLKRMNDFIGPIMISAISLIILIIALGVYLPIWNMINLVH